MPKTRMRELHGTSRHSMLSPPYAEQGWINIGVGQLTDDEQMPGRCHNNLGCDCAEVASMGFNVTSFFTT